jgi:tape measure domain-containing protein
VPVVAEVQVKVNASSAKAQLSGLEGASRKLQGAFGKLQAAGGSLQGVLAGLGAGAALKGFLSAGIEAQRTTKRLKLLSEGFGETKRLTDIANKAASKYAIGNTQAANAVADLYGRLRPMGISLDDIGTTFNAVNTAAAKMNLTAYETDGVLLQLSQALGSGTLQGDEFRSVMERLPAIGQAVADSLGVSVGELKKLGSDGKLTTDVIINALQGLADQPAPKPDAYKTFQKALSDLGTAIGQELVPAFTPLVEFAGSLVGAFSALPGPVKTVAAGFIALAGVAVILAPIASVAMSLGPAFLAVGKAIGVVVGLLTGGGGLLGAIAAVFTGPVGWIALAVGAGVAIYKFRDQIAAVFKVIGDIVKKVADLYMKIWIKPLLDTAKKIYKEIAENWKKIFKVVSDVVREAFDAYKRTFFDPVINTGKKIYSFFADTFRRVGDAIKAPIKAAMDFIKGIVNSVFSGIGSVINGFINNINRLISGANKISNAVGGPSIPTIPNVNMPQFAKGGVVNGPTVAMVGEAGPEYIIPERKAAAFAMNYLSGARGSNAIPRYAEGGYVGPINIQTGPVMQQGGTNYVTMAQFEDGLRSVVNSVTQNRSYGARRFQGVS